MAITINGTTGVAGVDGSASTPAVQGSDTNTGVTFGADTVNIVTGGTTRTTVDSSGNVGIGTSSPSSKLQVANGALTISDATTHAFLKISPNSGSAAFLDIPTVGSSLLIRTSASSTTDTNAVAVTSSGNVGIGGSPSTATRTTVQNCGSPVGYWVSSGVMQLQANAVYNSGDKFVGTGYALYYAQDPSSGAHVWSTSSASGTAGNAVTYTERMRIDSSGNVGIGTSSPNDKLTVASDNYLSFQTSSTTFNSGRVARIGGVSVGSGNGYLSFETYQGGSGGGERMRLESDGLLQISKGTYTGFWIGDAGYKMFVTSGRLVAQNGSNGVELAFNASAWAAYSDIRAKTSLTPITDAKTKLKTARTVTGRYITDSEDVSRSFLIAQDWFEILPESVDASDPERLSLRYTETIPLIAAAVNEQTDEIAELKAIIESLTARIAALEAQ